MILSSPSDGPGRDRKSHRITRDQGIAAARQGLHVLTDKAIDISTKRADALIDATDRANVKLGVIFQDRAQPEIRQLKRWIDQGLLGKILISRCEGKMVASIRILQ